MDLKQNGSELTGVARLTEPTRGQHEYSISGVAGEKPFVGESRFIVMLFAIAA